MTIFLDKRIKLIFYVYLFANIPALLNFGGVYYDDWCLINQGIFPNKIIFETGTWLLNKPTQELLLSFSNPIIILRLLTFFSFLYISFVILKTLDYLHGKRDFNLLLPIFFSLAPLFMARISLSCFFYTVSLTLYAFFIHSNYLSKKPNYGIKYAALFLSFTTNSLLFFHYAISIFLFNHINPIKNWRDLIKFVKSNTVSLVLPIIFLICKSTFLKPDGVYAVKYNQITFEGLLMGFPLSIKSLFYILKNWMSLSYANILLILFITFLLMRAIKNFELEPNLNKATLKKYFYTGLFLTLTASYPYAVVSKFSDGGWYNTRFELLSLLGFSVLVLALLIYIWNKFKSYLSFKSLAAVFISLFIVVNFNIYSSLLRFWLDNEALAYFFKQSDVVKLNTSFLFQSDLEKSPNNIMNKTFAYYELAGISKKVFGKADKLFSLQNTSTDSPFPYGDLPSEIKEREHYNLNDYVNTNFQYLLTFKQNKSISITKLIEFSILYLFSNKPFENNKLIKIYKRYYDFSYTKLKDK